MEKKIRSFVGIEPGPDVLDALVRAVERLRRAEARLAWVPMQNLHLSLAFLGEVMPEQLERMCSELEVVAREATGFELSVGGVGTFGRSGRPRVVWAGVEPHAGLSRLHAGVSACAVAAGIPVERRAFRGHITLGRVRGSRHVKLLLASVSEVRERHFGTICVDRVVLYRSELKPTGAEYAQLHAWQLGST